MKKIIAIVIILLAVGCYNSKNTNSSQFESEEYIDIIGVFDRKELNKNPHAKCCQKRIISRLRKSRRI